MKMRVLGAAGAMAQVVLRDLLEFAPDVEITAADLKPLAQPMATRACARRRSTSRDEAATARLLEGHDAVLNCVTYYFNVPIMRAALAARVPYADLGGLYHGSLKQFALHEDFVRAGVPALLGMGSTPGITNVMAGVLARGLDSVDAVHVRVGCIDRCASGPLPVPYALDTVLDEFSLEPMVFHDGRRRGGAADERPGDDRVSRPRSGRAEALYTLHSEVAMFPRSFPGLRDASFKVAFEPDFTEKVRFLVELGFASREKVGGALAARDPPGARGAADRAPGEPNDCDALRVDAPRAEGRTAASRAAPR